VNATERKTVKMSYGFPVFVLPYLLSSILLFLYCIGQISGLGIVAVNVLCLILFFLSLSLGLTERINTKKAQLLLTASFTSLSTSGVNLFENNKTLDSIQISLLYGWSLIWIVLLFVAAVSTLVVMIRIFHWSQNQWEEMKHLEQEKILSSEKHSMAVLAFNRLHQLIMLKIKNEQKEKHEKLTNPIPEGDNPQPESDIPTEDPEGKKDVKETPRKKYHALYAQCIGLFLALIFGFLYIPILENRFSFFSNWFSTVKALVEILNGKTEETGFDSFFYYLFFYTITLLVIFSFVYLLFLILKSKHDEDTTTDTVTPKKINNTDFLSMYQTPASILLVCSATLFSFVKGDIGTGNLTHSWQVLLFVILYILAMLTSVEIVRLVLEQCVTPHSLLREVIYYIFVAVMKFFSDIVLGVITNLHIKLVVDSLFALVFTEFTESEDSFKNKLDRKMDNLFHSAIASNDRKYSKNVFHRKRIWRRR